MTDLKKIINNILTQPNLWGGVLPLNILGSYALYTAFSLDWSLAWVLAFFVGYACIMMLGVSGCYHRLLSHKAFTVTRPVKIIMLWFASLAAQGGPIFWVVVHRGYHHRYSDRPGDPHSPIDGFWHSYILWMFKITKDDINPKYAIDLLKDSDCMFFHKHYIKILWISHIAFALINFQLWLVAMLLPAFVAFHSFSINTSLNHIKFMGYRSFTTKDDSVNSPITWFITFGEAWHNNHHADPKSANYGKQWWELDPTYWLIKLIRSN